MSAGLPRQLEPAAISSQSCQSPPDFPDDGLVRCPWPKQDPLYVAYHDTGMGRAGIRRPRALRETGARRLPGRALLDHHLAQARELPQSVRWIPAGEDRALYAEEDREADAGCRHRAQPRARSRARFYPRAAGSRSWKRARAFPICCGTMSAASRRRTTSAAPAKCPPKPRSRASCRRNCRGRGFKFVGPTIVYAFMQAVGMVNDHLVSCHRHPACAKPTLAGTPTQSAPAPRVSSAPRWRRRPSISSA